MPSSTQNLPPIGPSSNKWPKMFPFIVTLLGFLLLAYMGIGVVQRLSQIIAPVFVPLLISLAVAYILEPLVERFEAYRFSRSNSTIIALLLTGLFLGVLLFVFLPKFWLQLSDIIARLPNVVKSVASWAQPKLDTLRARNPAAFEKVFESFNEFTQDPSAVTEPVVGFVKGSILQIGSITASVLNLILIPLFIYYILVDFRILTGMLYQTVPPRNRGTVSELFGQVDAVLRNFVRGQLIVCSAMATLYVIAFFFLDVPMWFALGILSGFGHIVPYIGTGSAAVLVISFTAISHPEAWRIVAVIACYPIVQSIEGFILTPKILGEKLELHPFMVLVGIILGHHLFGILGIVLAAPVMASAKIFIGYLYQRYLKSTYYQRPASVSSQTIPFVEVGSSQIVSDNSFVSFTTGNTGKLTIPKLINPIVTEATFIIETEKKDKENQQEEDSKDREKESIETS